ncbi:hypothetical protein [Holospora curviuscula]|uniref:hypothetical protein n=1 Tax=Holospora curviuscula TaxID=1082868 RepID=UPI000CE5C779|nr:hypothetical protein [Holospora curviuscula]
MGCAVKKNLNHPKADPEKKSVLCQKRHELNSKVDERGFSRIYGCSVKGQCCYGKQDWGTKIE